MKKKRNKFRNYIKRLEARISLNKRAFAIYSFLRALVIITGIRCFFTKNYESLFLCILSLMLFLVPSFFEEKFHIEIPPVFQISIYCFIYAAEILGEVNQYYTRIPGWDTMLHTINGFLCAALGLSLVELLNRHSDRGHLSPFYLAFMAFCFSMTVGVMWEFFEFSMDRLFYLDMQKDFFVRNIGTVSLDPSGSQVVQKISDITRTIVETSDGQTIVIENGYLDIGIIDTMKDLFVNFIGALVFSIIGYVYESRYEKKEAVKSGKLAENLIWHNMTEAQEESEEEQIEEIIIKNEEKKHHRKVIGKKSLQEKQQEEKKWSHKDAGREQV